MNTGTRATALVAGAGVVAAVPVVARAHGWWGDPAQPSTPATLITAGLAIAVMTGMFKHYVRDLHGRPAALVVQDGRFDVAASGWVAACVTAYPLLLSAATVGADWPTNAAGRVDQPSVWLVASYSAGLCLVAVGPFLVACRREHPALSLTPDGIRLYLPRQLYGLPRRRRIPWTALIEVRDSLGGLVLVADPRRVRPWTVSRMGRHQTLVSDLAIRVDRRFLSWVISYYGTHPQWRGAIGTPTEYQRLMRDNWLAGRPAVRDDGARHVDPAGH